MKKVLGLRGGKRIIAVLIAVILLLSSLHFGLVSFADEHITVVRADGTSVGWFSATNHTITPNVLDVSPDGACVGVKVLNPQSGNKYNYFGTKKVDISELGLEPENVKTISLWIYNPEGNGDMIFRYNNYGSDYISINLDTEKAYLVDSNKGDLTLATQTSANWLTIPDGFKGYVVYDMTASTNLTKLNEYGYMDIKLWYKSEATQKNKYWYFDNVTYTTKNAEAVIDEYLSYVPAPIPSYCGNTVLPNQKITFTTDGASIEAYYTLDGTDPDVNSIKFDPQNPLKITEDVTVKVVAYRAGRYSEIITLDYEVYDPSKYKTAVLQDGSSIGSVFRTATQQVTAGVSDISPDNSCVEIMYKTAYDAILYVGIKPTPISNFDIAAKDINTLYTWVHNPKGNGVLRYRIAYRNSSPYAVEELLPGEYYLVDSVTGTYKKYVITDSTIYIDIPDGFQGYLVYDVAAADNRDIFVSDNFSKIFACYSNANFTAGTKFYYDNVTVSTETADFVTYCLAEACVPAPQIDSFTTYVKIGEKVNLIAEEGDIFYTLDGTKPTTASAKFNTANPIVISADTTIKAIAVKDGVSSVVSTFEYETIDPDAPNVDIVNDGTDISLFTTTASADISVIDDVSPVGSAYNAFGTASSGTGLFTFKFNSINSGLVLAKDAFSAWIKVPANKSFTFKPAFNSNIDGFEGTIVTYDTETGETQINTGVSEITLEGFEGYVMLMFDDDAKISGLKWYEYVKEKGMTSFILSATNSEFNRADVAFDTFGFVTDYDTYIAELSPAANRPDAPYARYASGVVVTDTNVAIYAATGMDIYYTLDGSLPTIDSTQYIELSIGGIGKVSPIEIREDTTVKAIAVNGDGVCSGVYTVNYIVEAKYEGPNAAIVNDCSGVSPNDTSWFSASSFEKEVVTEGIPSESALSFTRKEDKVGNFSSGIGFKANPDLEKPQQIKAFSVYLKLAPSTKATKINLRINGEANSLRGDYYAISTDGKVKTGTDSITFSGGFEGTILVIIGETVGMGVNYSSYTTDWPSFVRDFNFTSFYVYMTNFREDMNTVVIDNVTAYYDAEQTMIDFDIDGLLADYGINTYENSNMMVSNDCSGNRINGGLSAFSDTLTIEKSDVSNDDRNIAVKFGKGESFIEFPNNCKDETDVIANGVAFWVELPKGAGNTDIDIFIDENYSEAFVYNPNKHYYQIDVDGVITRVEGAIILPDGFRGWVVIPKANIICDSEKSVEITDGKINFESVVATQLIFKNTNDVLNGKTVYIDDISWYTDFAKLVKSRAYCWAGQVFED